MNFHYSLTGLPGDDVFDSWRHYTTNGQRKGVPNSWSGNSEAATTETCADTGNEQQFRVRRTQLYKMECNVLGINPGA